MQKNFFIRKNLVHLQADYYRYMSIQLLTNNLFRNDKS